MVISKDEVELYFKYEGDMDMFSRAASEFEKSIVKEGNWSTIENILNRLSAKIRGLNSVEFDLETERIIGNGLTPDARKFLESHYKI